eukprot:15312408-Alexandrium_andersonii.AAC.1
MAAAVLTGLAVLHAGASRGRLRGCLRSTLGPARRPSTALLGVPHPAAVLGKAGGRLASKWGRALSMVGGT